MSIDPAITGQDELFERALQLPEKKREELAHRLLHSLQNGDWETAWAEEIERRVAEMDAGLTEAEDWEVVLPRLRASLAQMRHSQAPKEP